MGELLLGGEKPKRRTARAMDWTPAKQKKFIDALTESCNVTFAAKKARVSLTTVYRQRSQDATFRAEWGRAVSAGYSQLEMMLLERALHGVEKPVPVKASEAGVMRHYDDRTALALLKLHRDGAAAAEEAVNSAEHEEACERIVERLARLKERLEGAIETKSAGDGHAVIRWALGFCSKKTLRQAQGERLSGGQAELGAQGERLSGGQVELGAQGERRLGRAR